MTNPHYPKIILSFPYRGFKIEIDRMELEGQIIYAAWANYDRGCAVAVPSAVSPLEAIQKAKKWIDRRLQQV
jgi:hypothetical protein